ncbi:MAG TPA: DUF5681 domain-containing protein [Terriglobales bacterium]|nr:DUF5681 domain-containing protein [Terriglobales bacterium]
MSTGSDTPQAMSEPAKDVGYGKPPESTRFKKGVSGNPRGRPKGSLNVATVFTKTLREKVIINEHGQRRTVTKLEAAVKQLVNKAASGDQRSMSLLLDLARDAEAKQNLPGAQQPMLSAADQEIIDNILKRFSETKEENSEVLEENDGNPNGE